MYQAAHYELVASAKAVMIGHAINPNFQIGCMIAMCPVYPATCKPEDILMAHKAMERRYYYADVHALGTYPPNITALWDRKGYDIDVTAEDLVLLQEGTVDYIGFSYYMSFATQWREENAHFEFDETVDLVKNPFVKASDWGWQIDPWACAMPSTGLPTAMACRCSLWRTALARTTRRRPTAPFTTRTAWITCARTSSR